MHPMEYTSIFGVKFNPSIISGARYGLVVTLLGKFFLLALYSFELGMLCDGGFLLFLFKIEAKLALLKLVSLNTKFLLPICSNKEGTNFFTCCIASEVSNLRLLF